jgi:hypothetical protein
MLIAMVPKMQRFLPIGARASLFTESWKMHLGSLILGSQ